MRLRLEGFDFEGETENMGVWTKERKGTSAEILMMMIFN